MGKISFAKISGCPCASCKHRETNINSSPCKECSVEDWSKYEYMRQKLTTEKAKTEDRPKFSFGLKP